MSQLVQLNKAVTQNGVYFTIGQAARYLNVSVDTIRRWESAKKLTAHRLDGKNRYFLATDIESFGHTRPLTTGEVAQELGVSESTVRRLETRGWLIPHRDSKGRRQYARVQLIGLLSRRLNAQSTTQHVQEDIAGAQANQYLVATIAISALLLFIVATVMPQLLTL